MAIRREARGWRELQYQSSPARVDPFADRLGAFMNTVDHVGIEGLPARKLAMTASSIGRGISGSGF